MLKNHSPDFRTRVQTASLSRWARQLPRLLVFAAALVVANGAALSKSSASPPVARTLARVPRTQTELATAFAASADGSEPLSPGAELGTTDFSQQMTVPTATGKTRQVPFARRPLLSYGTALNKADQADLPLLTGSRILERVNGDFVSIQARLLRDANGKAYLHQRPLAAVGSYGKTTASEFTDLALAAVGNIRGLGLYLPEGQKPRAENLRTWVGVSKGLMVADPAVDATEPGNLQTRYELLLVRARETDNGDLDLHVFVTQDGLQTLHYLPAYAAPGDASQCSIVSTVTFTEWAFGGQYPTARATRQAAIQSRSRVTFRQLDELVAADGRKGKSWDNLTWVLDAVIDGRLK